MYTLIDKVRVAPSSNIPTAGFQTLLLAVTGTAAFTGTQAEADAIKAGITATVSDNAAGTGAVSLNKEYITARVQGGSTNAFVEIVLTKPYLNAVTLGTGLTKGIGLLTLAAVSETSSS